MEDKKPLYYMILFSVIRHVLGGIGVWALAHRWITQDLLDRLISDQSVATGVAYFLAGAPIIWAILQKTQVWGWIKTALKMPTNTSPGDVPVASPGPNTPI